MLRAFFLGSTKTAKVKSLYCGYCCVTWGNIFQISSLEEKVTHYALKVAEHEKNALLSKKEHQNLKKELEEHLVFKEKYERLEN